VFGAFPATGSLHARQVRIWAHHRTQETRCSSDDHSQVSILFLENGFCIVAGCDTKGSTSSARFTFGARSGANSEFKRLSSTVASCVALEGFDVTFAQGHSNVIHCLPLGDYDAEQHFFPVLTFTRMPGTSSAAVQYETITHFFASLFRAASHFKRKCRHRDCHVPGAGLRAAGSGRC
jgi:hypothetical protein